MRKNLLRNCNSRFVYSATDQKNTSYDSSSPKTISGAAIGSQSTERTVFVVIGLNSDSITVGITSVTIGGVSATQAGIATTDYALCAIYYATVPTGTTADIVVTPSFSGSWAINTGIGVMYGGVTVEDSVTAADRTVSSLSVSSGSTILAGCREQALSPDTGADISSSPVGVELNSTASRTSGTTQLLVGVLDNAGAGTYSVTGSWDDSVSYRDAIVAISIA